MLYWTDSIFHFANHFFFVCIHFAYIHFNKFLSNKTSWELCGYHISLKWFCFFTYVSVVSNHFIIGWIFLVSSVHFMLLSIVWLFLRNVCTCLLILVKQTEISIYLRTYTSRQFMTQLEIDYFLHTIYAYLCQSFMKPLLIYFLLNSKYFFFKQTLRRFNISVFT